MRAARDYIFFISVMILAIWLLGFVRFIHDNVGIKNHLANNQDNEAIVVLTGGQGRIVAGFELLLLNAAPKLFISGVDKSSLEDIFLSTAEDIELSDLRKKRNDIVLGRNAKNTVENALEVKEWVEKEGITHIILVTSDYHMPRSILEIRKVLPNLVITPYRVSLDTESEDYLAEGRVFRLLVMEYSKFMVRKLTTFNQFLTGANVGRSSR